MYKHIHISEQGAVKAKRRRAQRTSGGLRQHTGFAIFAILWHTVSVLTQESCNTEVPAPIRNLDGSILVFLATNAAMRYRVCSLYGKFIPRTRTDRSVPDAATV